MCVCVCVFGGGGAPTSARAALRCAPRRAFNQLVRPPPATRCVLTLPGFGPLLNLAQVLRLVSLPLWRALSPGRLQLELHAQPALAKKWKALQKKDAKAAAAGDGERRARQRLLAGGRGWHCSACAPCNGWLAQAGAWVLGGTMWCPSCAPCWSWGRR